MKKVNTLIYRLTLFLCLISIMSLEAAWTPPVTISENGSFSPVLGIDARGNVRAVWVEFNNPYTYIKSAFLSKGGDWSSPVSLSSFSGKHSGQPQIAIDPNGNSVAVWEEVVNSQHQIKASTLKFGGSWSPPVVISPSNHRQEDPQIAIDQSGNAVAVWTQSEKDQSRIQSARLPLGGKWSSAVDLSSSTTLSIFPQIAVDPAGNALAIWNADHAIQSARLPYGGSWSTPVNVATPDSIIMQTPQIAVDSQGNAIALWMFGFPGKDSVLNASTLPFQGKWSDPVTISKPTTDALQYNFKVVIDRNGNALAVWDAREGFDDYFIAAATLPFKGKWSDQVRISPAEVWGYRSQVALDFNGNATAIWTMWDLKNFATIQAATLPFNGSWSPPTNLSKMDKFADNPQIAVDPTGYAVAVWDARGAHETEFIDASSRVP